MAVEVDTEVRPEGHKIPHRANLNRYRDDAGVQRARGQRPARVVGPTHNAGDDRPEVERDSYAHDAGGIRRIVRKGSRLPVGWTLIDDDESPPEVESATAEPDKLGEGGEEARQGEGEQEGNGDENPQPVDYSSQTVPELEAEVERRRAEGREIEVTGSGARGKVKEGDLVAALEADDAARANEG